MGIFFAFIGKMDDWHAKTLERIMRNTGLSPSGCILWLGGPTDHIRQPYGQIKISHPGPYGLKGCHYVHRIAYICHTRPTTLPDKSVEISHRCHVPRCVRVDHLTAETRETNAARHWCVLQRQCTKNHQPFCIFD